VGHGVTVRAPLNAECSAAMMALRVSELRLLAAATAVVWGRSQGKSFEQIARKARDGAERFVEQTRRAISRR
jgi:hypothetical protein